MSLAVRALRSTFFVAVGSYSTMLISFSSTLILARLLDPADFGVFSLSLFFVGFLDVTGKLGLDYSLIHRKDVSGPTLSTHFALAILASFASVAAGIVAGLLLPFFGYDHSVTRVLIVLVCFLTVQAAGLTSRITLEKELRFARTMAVTVASLLTSSVLSIALAWSGAGMWSLVIGSITNTTLLTFGMWLVSPWRPFQQPFKFDRTVGKWFLSYGAMMTVGSFASIIILQFDNFLVGSLAGISVLGFYDRAYRLAHLPTGLVTHVASKSSFSLYAKVQDERERLSRAFRVTLELILMLSLPIAVVIFVAAPEIVMVLLGEKWLPSVPLLRLLLGYSVLRPMQDDIGALLAATGRTRALGLLLSIEAGLVILVATPLTLLFGAQGTAMGVNVAFIVGLAIAFWLAKKSVNLNLARLARTPILAASAGFIVWYVLLRTVGSSGMPILMILGLKGGGTLAVYAAVTVLLEREHIKPRVRYIWDVVRGASGLV